MMRKPFGYQILTEKTYYKGISELTVRDSGLAEAVLRWGNPPFWTHTPGFPGIVLSILSQQVSLESAQATFGKLGSIIDSIHPEAFLTLDDRTLRAIGFSRQKASYVRGLAHEIMGGELNLEGLESMTNDQVRKRLMNVRGIGAWTADAYLLFALRRADAWPTGDLALAIAIQELSGSSAIPDPQKVDRIADHWRPWRAVAARILWHHYLNKRGRAVSG
jgi:DNA-3-methyladenine glycosylase II